MNHELDPAACAEELRRFVDATFLFGAEVAYGDDDSFLENSIIDSAGVLELIAHLETRYGVVIADEDLVPENLDSINNIVRFIQRKHAAAVAAAGATSASS